MAVAPKGYPARIGGEARPSPNPQPPTPNTGAQRLEVLGLLSPALLLIAGMFGVAMLLLFAYSIYSYAGGRIIEIPTLATWTRFFTTELYLRVLRESAQLGAIVTLIALLIGYPTAYAISKVRDPRLLAGIYIVMFSPLLVSVIVRAYGWLLLLSEEGVINWTLRWLGVIPEPLKLLFNQTGVLIALVHILLPFMVFPILSVLGQMNPALKEAAQDLGASRLETFWRVTLPLSLPGVASACSIVFTLAVSAFVTPSLLGGGKVLVLSRQIYNNVVDVNWPMAAVQAIVLLAMALTIVTVFRALGRGAAASSAGRAPAEAERTGFDPVRWALYALLVVVLIYMLAPIVFVVVNSFNESAYSRFPPEGFSLRWYGNVFAQDMFRTGALNSIVVAIGSTVVALVTGMLAAFALVRYRFRGRTLLAAFFLSPLIMPKVAVGISLFILFVKLGIFGTTPSLALAHAALTAPFVISILSAQLVSLDPTLEEAAQDLGAPPWLTFWRVVLPQLKVGLIVAGLFALITSFDETETSIFLYRPANITLPIAMFLYLEQRQDPTLAALSTLFILMTLVPVLLALPVLRGQELRRLLERS